MAFYGCEFTFDGIPCSEYGLMIYDFDSKSQEDVTIGAGDIVEDRLLRRFDSLMYSFNQNQPLEYSLVFGANLESIDACDSIDRHDIEAIAAWLTGHQKRKWLTIEQPDMDTFRYKCIITDLELVTDGNVPWAFTCNVNCDSQFAYTNPDEYQYDIKEKLKLNIHNRSSYNGYIYPILEISNSSNDKITITNHSDGNRIFELKDIPNDRSLVINIDNKNQIITNNLGFNLYPNFNKKFFRMVRGDNILTISGNATIKFICEFPVNIGG